MLHPDPISHFLILGPISELDHTLDLIYEQKIVQIEDFQKITGLFKIGHVNKNAPRSAQALISLRTLSKRLKLDEDIISLVGMSRIGSNVDKKHRAEDY